MRSQIEMRSQIRMTLKAFPNYYIYHCESTQGMAKSTIKFLLLSSYGKFQHWSLHECAKDLPIYRLLLAEADPVGMELHRTH